MNLVEVVALFFLICVVVSAFRKGLKMTTDKTPDHSIFPGLYRHHKRGNLYYAIDVASLAGGGDYTHVLLMTITTGELIIYPAEKFNSIETLASGEKVRYFTKVPDTDDKEIRKLKRQSVSIFVEEFASMIHSMKEMNRRITELQKRNSDYHDEICALKSALDKREEKLKELLEDE